MKIGIFIALAFLASMTFMNCIDSVDGITCDYESMGHALCQAHCMAINCAYGRCTAARYCHCGRCANGHT